MEFKGDFVDEIKYQPIGIIHTPYKEPKGTPIQPLAGEGTTGTIEIYQDYIEGLQDLEGFSHILLIFHFHLSKKYSLKVKPFLDKKERGVFATRSPSRPNPIGLSIVRLLRIQENTIFIQDMDIIDGTPLLDIKPHVPELDVRERVKKGWLEGKLKKFSTTKDNGKFSKTKHKIIDLY